MPMANGTQHSRGRLELFEASTRNNQWRHWDEPSGSGTPRTVSVRRSVLMERWLHVPEAEDRQDAFWRFFWRKCPVSILPITGRSECPRHYQRIWLTMKNSGTFIGPLLKLQNNQFVRPARALVNDSQRMCCGVSWMSETCWGEETCLVWVLHMVSRG